MGIYRVIASATSTVRIAAAIASGQKLSLGELPTGPYCSTLKPVPGPEHRRLWTDAACP